MNKKIKQKLLPNDTELDQEFRSIISHAFLGDEHAAEISRENFDLAINGCVEYAKKLIKINL